MPNEILIIVLHISFIIFPLLIFVGLLTFIERKVIQTLQQALNF